ncbi:MAG: right-handed parallel beta-helix repeat-containing protein [Sedimentisphaerales bacterium]|nr:right-handed parallel beta-helix repeat-containing protein [Sedimentisphaerales bacterium]
MKRLYTLILPLLYCSGILAAELYVRPGDYNNIQSAINDANNGSTIIVDPCTYYENINFLGKAITLTSTNPNEPNIVAATIIDGSLPADSNYGSVVTFNSGEGNDSVLTGFTITGGTGSWLQIYWEFKGYLWNRCGGGVLCYNSSSPTVTKNVFTGNIAGQGGGIYFYDHSNPLVSSNTFINNHAVKDHGFEDPDPEDVNIYDHGDGGAIVGFQYCDATITNNLIENNSADYYGGGIHLRQWSDGLVEDNQVIDNNAKLGGGIHITYTSAPTVRENLIKDNYATSLGGGGIYIYYLSYPIVERNLIIQNESTNGAGIGTYWESEPIIRNNIIADNIKGAGIIIKGGSIPIITHNTIVRNEPSPINGGGIECLTDSIPVIENNIIALHQNAFGIYNIDGMPAPLIRYNNVWGNGNGNYNSVIGDQTGINGNISKDPCFTNPDNDDFHINYNSPCINTGDPNFADFNQTDYDGKSRILGEFTDIGACEANTVWNITDSSQFNTIQGAIDNANNGDVIVLTIGRYTGNGNRDIDFHGKAATVRSIDPNNSSITASTIIDCQGSPADAHRGFNFHSGEEPNSIVEGLTVTNAGGSLWGAIYCIFDSSPTIRKCIVRNNSMHDHGGGFYCGYGSNPLIIDCIITDNTFTTVGYGGAIYLYHSSPTITNCIMMNNSAVGHGRHGGGICSWGDQDGSSDPVVTNCIIAGNSAGHRGGGLYSYWCNPTYINCTVIGNNALEGGGIGSFREANPQVINCIVRDNIAPDGNQLALINTIRVWPWSIGTQMFVKYSDVEGGYDDATIDAGCTLNWGPGNIDAEPNFVDAGWWDFITTPNDLNDAYSLGNYHLLPGSACQNAGDNNSLPPYATLDIDYEQRIFEENVDMGADEIITNPYDLNWDGIVDFNELNSLTTEWLQSGPGLETDFYEDQFIDFHDFALLAEQWFWKTGWYH